MEEFSYVSSESNVIIIAAISSAQGGIKKAKDGSTSSTPSSQSSFSWAQPKNRITTGVACLLAHDDTMSASFQAFS